MAVGDLTLERMRERGQWPPQETPIGAGKAGGSTGLITPIWPVEPLGSFTFQRDNRASALTPILHAGVNRFSVEKDHNLVKVIQEITFRITNPRKAVALNDVRLSAFIEGAPIREFQNLAVGNGARISTKIAVPPQSAFELQLSMAPAPEPLPVPSYTVREWANAVQYNGQIYVFGGFAPGQIPAVTDYLVSNDEGRSWVSRPYPFVLGSLASSMNCSAVVWDGLVWLFLQEIVAGVVKQSIYTFDGIVFSLKKQAAPFGTTSGDTFYFNAVDCVTVNPNSGRFVYFGNAARLFYSDDKGQTWVNPGVLAKPANFASDLHVNPMIYYDGFYYGFVQAYNAGGIYAMAFGKFPENLTAGSGVWYRTNVPPRTAFWVLVQNHKVYLTFGRTGVNTIYSVPLDQMETQNWSLAASNQPYMDRSYYAAVALDSGGFLFVTGVSEVQPYKVKSFLDSDALGLAYYVNVNGIKLPLKQSIQHTLITP